MLILILAIIIINNDYKNDDSLIVIASKHFIFVKITGRECTLTKPVCHFTLICGVRSMKYKF